MVGILDIAPAKETISLAGVTIDIFGVSVKDVMAIIVAFPEVRLAFSGGDWSVDKLMVEAPAAISSIIAAGVGHGGEQDYIDRADKLEVEHQMAILETVMRISLPSGLASFLDRLQRLSAGIGVTAPEKVPATTSQKPSKD